jgi:hypothetical protein
MANTDSPLLTVLENLPQTVTKHGNGGSFGIVAADACAKFAFYGLPTRSPLSDVCLRFMVWQ